MDVDAETGQPVRDRPWAPPKSWTAWPLRAALVPPDDFMKRTEDEDEAFTFRRFESETPSSKLEEVVSAAILRCAKEKFRARSFDEAEKPAQENLSIKKEPLSSGNESLSDEAESEDEKMDLGAVAALKQKQGHPSQRSFKPAIATDDDVSYKLIRPSARFILEKLDQTLKILHNARMTSAQDLVDAANASSSEDESLYDEATPGRPSRSRATSRARSVSRASTGTAWVRSRSTSREVGESVSGETPANPAKPKSKRGRKAQSKPREGETEREFLIRRAKEQKKKRPVFPDEDGGGGIPAIEAAKDDAKSSARRQVRGRRESRTGDVDCYWAQKRLARLNLRDWSDVMGAAALAGFAPRVVESATQRCTDLFREGMEMHTVAETPASSGVAGTCTRRYVPGEGVSSRNSDADEENGDIDTRQARSISRKSSAAPIRTVSRAASPGLGKDNEHGQDSPRKRQKRSTSCGSAVGSHYCPHMDCERAYRGFDRPFNLKRHLKLVHGGEGPRKLNLRGLETEDLLGGIHRDGFLEPIQIQKGWRAEDVKKRAKKRPSIKRRRDENSDEEGSGSEESSTGSPSGSEEG